MRSATEQAALVRAGEISATELVEASLREIETRGELNAFVRLCAQRALAEAARVRPGDPPRDAGAVLVGKTNTPELGMRPVTEPRRFGATRNPRDLRLSPGGSSGGSAAAVAAWLVALCDGSDMGGSIRIPAACCGVVGLKPSAGLVPSGPDLEAAGASVASFGPIANTVCDAALALDVLAGTERFAAAAASAPGRLPVRVGLTAPLGVEVDEAPRAAVARAAQAAAALGHDVREEAPDWDDDGFRGAWMTASTAVMQRIIPMLERLHGRPVDPAALEPETREWLLSAKPVPAATRASAFDRLAAYARRVLRDWPADGVLLAPTITRPPIEVSGLRARPGVTDDAGRFSAVARVFNVTGQPALSLPVGLTTGVQVVGPPGRDDLVLSFAAQLEEALG